jgi:SM-20-related protein
MPYGNLSTTCYKPPRRPRSHMRGSMIQLDYTALRDTPVATDPFPHVVVPNFVPPASLHAVLADMPTLARTGSYPADSIRPGPATLALIQAMEGPDLRQAIAEKFAIDLTTAPTMLTVRGRTGERDGRIHCDSTAKRVTVLLYLNEDIGAFGAHVGCLRLLRGPRNLEDYAVEVPPVNGTLLIFPNGPTSWHGHKTFDGPRTSMQLNYMTTDQKARSELRRHRLSAFVKRLTQAA